MGWPSRRDTWRNDAEPARAAFAAVAREISAFEPVVVCANRGDDTSLLTGPSGNMARIVNIDHDDAWFRDTGPMFVERRGGELVGLNWNFNAWGGVYESCVNDTKVARTILDMEGLECVDHKLVLEGGSVHSDGEGTLLTTEECLLHPSRNPTASKGEIETALKHAFGATTVIWLPRGLVGDDDTNGHVDNMACFIAPGRVALAWTDDVTDPQHAVSSEAFDILSSAVDARGRKLEVVKIPLPPPQFMTQEEADGVQFVNGSKPRRAGDRLAASYVNFYIVNGGVIAPAFGGDASEADERARIILQSVFPDRTVVQVPSREILLGGGNIHCITMQQPMQNFYV